MLTYRDASRSDLKEIVNIYNSTISSRMVTADTTPISVDSRLAWFDQHNPNNRPLLVIEDDAEKIIAWVSFQSFYGRPAYDATVEISIYIDESQRGKGLGKKILLDALERAKHFGAKTVLGFIFAHNKPSIKLFKHFGFEEWGTLPDIALLDGVEYSLKILGKRIV